MQPTVWVTAALSLLPLDLAQPWVAQLDQQTTGQLYTSAQNGSAAVEQLVAGFAADPLLAVAAPLVPEAVLLAAGLDLKLISDRLNTGPCTQDVTNDTQIASCSLDCWSGTDSAASNGCRRTGCASGCAASISEQPHHICTRRRPLAGAVPQGWFLRSTRAVPDIIFWQMAATLQAKK